MKTEPNHSAYPTKGFTVEGLTKRELFAAIAMQGFTANSKAYLVPEEKIADYSVKTADALIAALNKDAK